MIVRKILDFRIIIRVAWKRLLSLLLVSTLVFFAYEWFWLKDIAISTIPASILGVAIAFLIGFRVNSAYERWWEARRIWGSIVNDSRSFARQVLSLLEAPEPIKQQLVKNQIAFVYALKNHLRKQAVMPETAKFLSMEDASWLEKQKHIPNALLLHQGRQIRKVLNHCAPDDLRFLQLDSTLNRLCDSMGAAERIKNTIFPRQYSFYSTQFTRIYSYLLPFFLVKECGVLVIPFTLLIGYIFFALDGIAGGIENPFENTFNDTPMNAICRTIEINLLEMLEENDLPEPVQPVNGFLY